MPLTAQSKSACCRAEWDSAVPPTCTAQKHCMYPFWIWYICFNTKQNETETKDTMSLSCDFLWLLMFYGLVLIDKNIGWGTLSNPALSRRSHGMAMNSRCGIKMANLPLWKMTRVPRGSLKDWSSDKTLPHTCWMAYITAISTLLLNVFFCFCLDCLCSSFQVWVSLQLHPKGSYIVIKYGAHVWG